MNEGREALIITPKLKPMYGAYLVAETVIAKDSYSKEDIRKLAKFRNECEKLVKNKGKRNTIHRRSAISRLSTLLEQIDTGNSYPLSPDMPIEFEEGADIHSLRDTFALFIDELVRASSKEEFKETRSELRKLIHEDETLKPFRQKVEGLFGKKFCKKFAKKIKWSPFFENGDWHARMDGQLLEEDDKAWFKKKLAGHFGVSFEEDDESRNRYRLVVENIGDYICDTSKKLEDKNASSRSSVPSFSASAGASLFASVGVVPRTIHTLPPDEPDPENEPDPDDKIVNFIADSSGHFIS